MKAYLFSMTLCHYRTFTPMGKSFGVVFAEDEEQALQIAWDKYGSDLACKLSVQEVPEGGSICNTVYNGMM